MQRAVAEGLVCGLSTRKYRRAVQSVLSGYGIRKSSVSRHFVRATAQQLAQLCDKPLGALDLVALLIDGIEFKGQTLSRAGRGQKRLEAPAGVAAGNDGKRHRVESAAGRPGRTSAGRNAKQGNAPIPSANLAFMNSPFALGATGRFYVFSVRRAVSCSHTWIAPNSQPDRPRRAVAKSGLAGRSAQ